MVLSVRFCVRSSSVFFLQALSIWRFLGSFFRFPLGPVRSSFRSWFVLGYLRFLFRWFLFWVLFLLSFRVLPPGFRSPVPLSFCAFPFFLENTLVHTEAGGSVAVSVRDFRPLRGVRVVPAACEAHLLRGPPSCALQRHGRGFCPLDFIQLGRWRSRTKINFIGFARFLRPVYCPALRGSFAQSISLFSSAELCSKLILKSSYFKSLKILGDLLSRSPP